MSTTLPMSSLELHTSATALILASARGDTAGMTHLLIERSHQDLLAMLAYCARFAAQLARTTYQSPGTDPIELLERFALALAGQPTGR